MRYADESEKYEIKKFIDFAVEEAQKSTCRKSQRGVVIVKEEMIIGRGHNHPTIEGICCVRENNHSDSGYDACPAIHAEQMAIFDAVNHKQDLKDSRLYHIKAKDGNPLVSGKPSCTNCSKAILFSGISEVVLLHEEGYAIYGAEEFNRLSLEYHKGNSHQTS